VGGGGLAHETADDRIGADIAAGDEADGRVARGGGAEFPFLRVPGLGVARDEVVIAAGPQTGEFDDVNGAIGSGVHVKAGDAVGSAGGAEGVGLGVSAPRLAVEQDGGLGGVVECVVVDRHRGGRIALPREIDVHDFGPHGGRDQQNADYQTGAQPNPWATKFRTRHIQYSFVYCGRVLIRGHAVGGLHVFGEQVASEVAVEIAPHGVHVRGAVLDVVVLVEKRGTLDAEVMGFTFFGTADPAKPNGIGAGGFELVPLQPRDGGRLYGERVVQDVEHDPLLVGIQIRERHAFVR